MPPRHFPLVSRWVILSGSAILLLLLPAWRFAFNTVFLALTPQRILFLDTNTVSRKSPSAWPNGPNWVCVASVISTTATLRDKL